MKKSVLCLVSGGIDSTVLLKHYLDKGWDVKGFFVNYGQGIGKLEFNQVECIANLLSIPTWCTEVLRPCLSVEDKFFYPMRNAFLLTYAINLAHFLKIPYVAIGCNQGEFLDQRPEFIDRFNFMQEYCLKNPIWVLAPFASWSSERVIKYGLKIGAPLNLTVSCMEVPACGKCLKCKLKEKYNLAGEGV